MTKVRIEGYAELNNALRELPKATQKNVLRRVLLQRAQPIADTARALAPDDPKTGGNDLHSSVAVSTKLSPRQAGIHKKMFRNDKASAEVFAGAGPLPQAHLMEFIGGAGGPQPFMRPAWDATKDAVLDGISDDLWKEIAAAAKRLANKAARAAAKAAQG